MLAVWALLAAALTALALLGLILLTPTATLTTLSLTLLLALTAALATQRLALLAALTTLSLILTLALLLALELTIAIALLLLSLPALFAVAATRPLLGRSGTCAEGKDQRNQSECVFHLGNQGWCAVLKPTSASQVPLDYSFSTKSPTQTAKPWM